MCNANNHAPDCKCGWGHGVNKSFVNRGPDLNSLGTLVHVNHKGNYTYKGTCAACEATIYTHVNSRGRRKVYDKIRPSWVNHVCRKEEAERRYKEEAERKRKEEIAERMYEREIERIRKEEAERRYREEFIRKRKEEDERRRREVECKEESDSSTQGDLTQLALIGACFVGIPLLYYVLSL